MSLSGQFMIPILVQRDHHLKPCGFTFGDSTHFRGIRSSDNPQRSAKDGRKAGCQFAGLWVIISLHALAADPEGHRLHPSECGHPFVHVHRRPSPEHRPDLQPGFHGKRRNEHRTIQSTPIGAGPGFVRCSWTWPKPLVIVNNRSYRAVDEIVDISRPVQQFRTFSNNLFDAVLQHFVQGYRAAKR
jgi:hypothetical protein